MVRNRILVVDGDALIRTEVSDRLERAGHNVRVAGSIAEANLLMRTVSPDLAVLDVKLAGCEGGAWLRELVELNVPCVMLTAHETLDCAVKALAIGARDYLEKPIVYERLDVVVSTALEVAALKREASGLRGNCGDRSSPIGASSSMTEFFRHVEKVAALDHTSVLIQGELGSGKGTAARMLHRLSPRAAQPFVRVRCSGLGESQLDAELFGLEKGPITGASALQHGLVELAHHGTIFLQEVGDLPLRLQSKLLQLIESRTFRRVGATRDSTVDVRVVAASSRCLERDVEQGRFRAELYYRLHGVTLHVPPLRQRGADITELARHFLTMVSRDLGKRVHCITNEALDLMRRYEWPGNVRELRNVVERGVLLADTDVLGVDALPLELRQPTNGNGGHIDIGPDGMDICSLERTLLFEALRRADGNRTSAGRLLGLSRHQIRNRLKKYGVEL